eukprot:m.39301 g.39301  ORF g.39301 m.39301 type:complete len:1162 (-) comp10296_c0_seq1:231-3716(-)
MFSFCTSLLALNPKFPHPTFLSPKTLLFIDPIYPNEADQTFSSVWFLYMFASYRVLAPSFHVHSSFPSYTTHELELPKYCIDMMNECCTCPVPSLHLCFCVNDVNPRQSKLCCQPQSCISFFLVDHHRNIPLQHSLSFRLMINLHTYSPLDSTSCPMQHANTNMADVNGVPSAPWALTGEETLKQLDVSADKGLTKDQVTERQATFGPNELPAEEGTSIWELIVEQFDDLLVKVLLGAAGISFILAFQEEPEDQFTAFVEPFVILVILILNAMVGVWQERNAESAIAALKEYEAETAKVIRQQLGPGTHEIPTVELVPGDIVEVATGDKVPADVRLLQIYSTTLKVDQSILTGESDSVMKNTKVVAKTDGVVDQDKINLIFSGTEISSGKAMGVVVSTGQQTSIGKINKGLQDAEADKKTPLKIKIEEFGEQLCKYIMYICIAVWAINIKHFNDPMHDGNYLKGAIYYFKIAVALAVAAIPEGLPAVITTCLALGTRRMAKKNALVRKLPSVETLGCTSVICSDKTGTLTTNQMCVTDFFLVGSDSKLVEYQVEGSSFDPAGKVLQNGKAASFDSKAAQQFAAVCSVCNASGLSKNEKGYVKIGEPTETALLVLVEKMNVTGTSSDALLAKNQALRQQYKRLQTLEFTRDRKSMSEYVAGPDGNCLAVKGAPERILERCKYVRLADGTTKELTPALRKAIQEQTHLYGTGEHTLRCLGMAIRDQVPELEAFRAQASEPSKFVELEQDLTFLGVAGMRDPPREEVKQSIQECKAAGIRVIVITGDNIDTAKAICKRIGVFASNENADDMSYIGSEFGAMSEEQKKTALKTARLFARVEPAHKTEIVRLLKAAGEVSAMTGDGVNDAPALKEADIGIAMGTGTAVAKSAAAMVLADDNFSTIVSAVEEGRAIYNNTKQFIRYLISSNIGEVVSIFLTAALGLPEALIPVQLLWVNLVTDGLPATALSFNPPDFDIMDKPPRHADDELISPWLFFRYMAIGVYVGAATVAGSVWWFMFCEEGPMFQWSQLTGHMQCTASNFEADFMPGNPNFDASEGCDIFQNQHSMTMALSILVVIELLNALNSVSEDQSLLVMPPWRNWLLIGADLLSLALHFMILYVPFMASLFQLVPLSWNEWQWVLVFSVPVIFLDEILKLIARSTGRA